MSNVKLAIIYYSVTGTNYKLAQWAAESARAVGAEVRILKTPELASEEKIQSNPLWAAHLKATEHIAEVTKDDLQWADALIFSIPSRFGGVPGPVKQFLDSTGDLWFQGRHVKLICQSNKEGSTMLLKGIHHLSAITKDARANYDFYTRILGMRLVKKTVNQDDPSMYHLFFGDAVGNPGTELTFFEIPSAGPTYRGVNSISATSLRVPSDKALQYWQQRFTEYGVAQQPIAERAGHLALPFEDPEGQRLILVSDEHNQGVEGGIPWDQSPVPAEYAIIGLGPIKLTVQSQAPTAKVLTQLMGFRQTRQYAPDQEGQPDILVFETGEGGNGAEIHLEERNDLPIERPGRGSVHHVAFRVEDDEAMQRWVEHISAAGFNHSGFVDRFYFSALYFREPNGILFELSTDGPGFVTDEHIDHLGESLALPPFLEHYREQIEMILKPLAT